MAGCTDEHFEKMLYAYELGMLSDEDRTAVEMHHLECDYCFEKAKKFNESARFIRSDSSVRESIKKIAASKTDAGVVKTVTPEKGRWPIWLRTSIAAAAMLAILVLQPWKIEISPEHELFASENLLIVMNFNNMAGTDDSLKSGEIIANLIITDLSESQDIQIVSNQHLFDITKRLGRDDERVFDNESVLQIAREANARWTVTGNILQVDPVIIVTSQLIDIASGNVLNTQKIIGEPGTTIFTLADSLSVLIKSDLPLESRLLHEKDRMVADVTTHSEVAYRYYLEGVDYRNRAYYAEAVEKFEKALEYDSTFAMVYYHLSNLKDQRLIEKAVEYADHTTQMEKYYINSRKTYLSGDIPGSIAILQKLIDQYPFEKGAYYLIGTSKFRLRQYEDAANYMKYCIKLDPLYKDGYNMLSYAYSNMGEFDKALEMNDKFIFLSPNEANPYDSRGDIYKIFKLYDDAIEAYQMALEKKPDFHASWSSLGNVYTFKGDFVQAERCFKVIAAVEDIYVWTNGKVLLGHNLLYQGKFAEALAMLEIGSEEDKKAHGEKRYATYHHIPALMYEELGDYRKALDELEKADSISKGNASYSTYWRRYKTRIVANSGDLEWAKKIADTLKNGLENKERSLGEYWYALGAIEMAQKNFAGAENNFRKAVNDTEAFDYASYFMLGISLYNLDRLDESITTFNDLLDVQDSLPQYWTLWDSRVYYYLGLALEKSGQINRAVENYKKYINIRKDADVELLTVIDARKRLSDLIS